MDLHELETRRSRSPLYGEAGYKRIANDAYFTPEWVTRVLLDQVFLPKNIWEPACGDGAIAKVLKETARNVYASDIANYGYGEPGLNFFAYKCIPAGFNAIVTNPPYTQAEAFIKHALALTLPLGGMVAMLLRHDYDTAKRRASLWQEPFRAKIVLTRRPNWTASRKASPRHNFSWYIWDWNAYNAQPEPVIRWQRA